MAAAPETGGAAAGWHWRLPCSVCDPLWALVGHVVAALTHRNKGANVAGSVVRTLVSPA